MDDKNENQSGNLDDFEFESYPEDNADSTQEQVFEDKSSDAPSYEGFEEYKDDGNEIAIPVLPASDEEGFVNPENNQEQIQPSEQPKVNEITPEEKARRAALRRERLRKEQEREEAEKEKRKKSMKVTLVIFGLLLFVMWFIYYALYNMMPEHLMQQGKKYMDVQEYQKALKMFKGASNARPYDPEPVYYQALALSKMPPTLENQAALYEISQLDNCDKASEYADAVMLNMKKQIDKQVGPNYAGNVLYNDVVFRWNIKEPVTYYINNQNSSSGEYLAAVRKAFVNWSSATNGELIFKELQEGDNANIVISFLDSLASSGVEDPERTGIVNPTIDKNVLEKVDISLKTKDAGGRYDPNRFRAVAQHEIGHAIGIWGHSSNPGDIMYYNGDYIGKINSVNISRRDSNTASVLYKMIPDAINKPLTPKEKEGMFYHYLITSVPSEDFEIETQRMLAKDKNNISAWVDLAISYGIKKRYKHSNFIFNRILPYVRNDANNKFVILYNMSANYYKMREYNMAEKFLKMATSIRTDIDTEILEAFIDLKLKRKQAGKNKLMLLHDRYPDNIEIAVKLAEVYYFDNEKDKSKQVIDKLLKVNPDAKKEKRVLKYYAYNAKAAREKSAKEAREAKSKDKEQSIKSY